MAQYLESTLLLAAWPSGWACDEARYACRAMAQWAKTNSPVSEEASQGVCYPCVSSWTPTRTALNISSIGRPGCGISRSRCTI